MHGKLWSKALIGQIGIFFVFGSPCSLVNWVKNKYMCTQLTSCENKNSNPLPPPRHPAPLTPSPHTLHPASRLSCYM